MRDMLKRRHISLVTLALAVSGLAFAFQNFSFASSGQTGCKPAIVQNGSSESAYPGDVLYNPKDQYYYLPWVWRGGFGVQTNHDLSVIRSKDLKNWSNSCGEPVSLPVTPGAHSTVDQIGMERGLANVLRISLNEKSDVVIVYQRYNDHNRMQIFTATFNGTMWKIHQLTNWQLADSAPSGGGSIQISGNTVGSGSVEVRHDDVSRDDKAFIQLYKAANDLSLQSSPGSGYYQIQGSAEDSLALVKTTGTPAKSVPASLLEATNAVVINNNPLNVNARGIIHPSNWNASTQSPHRVFWARDLAQPGRHLREDTAMSWRGLAANRDLQYDCQGDPTTLNPNLKTSQTADAKCPAYFLSDLHAWNLRDGKWESELVARVWSGSLANFDYVVRGQHEMISYYDVDRKLTVKIKESGQSWSTASTKRLLATPFNGWDSHNSIASHIGPDGVMHVTGNLHSYGVNKTPIEYFRSESFSVGSLYRRDFMSGYREDQATYPEFFEATIAGQNQLAFRYRHGESGNGITQLKFFNELSGEWRDLGALFSASSASQVNANPAFSSRPIIGAIEPSQLTPRRGQNLISLSGWVCQPGNSRSIAYSIYAVGSGETRELISAGVTDAFDSGPELKARCESNHELHRFRRYFKPQWLERHLGKRFELYGRLPGQREEEFIGSGVIPSAGKN